MTTAAAIILSGGASSRMGSPKALLTAPDGQTFADRLVSLFRPHCDQVIVVTGFHARAIQAGMRNHARIIVNPQPERGQLTSLQAGFAALDPMPDLVFFTPVDYPSIAAETIAALLAEAARHPDAAAIVPEFEGHHGHPVLLSARLVNEILALPVQESARSVIHRHVPETRYVQVNDPGVLRDIDYPADYQALLETEAVRR